MRLRHRLPPQSRLVQSIPSWVDPGALLAMQFGPDRYWRKRGGLLPATSVLTTTRSSGINLPNAAGVFQTHGNNVLPRTDRGLYANGQIAALNANGNNPQSATGWRTIIANVTSGPLVNGFFNSAYVASTGNSVGGRDAYSFPVQNGRPVAFKAYFREGVQDSGEVRILTQAVSGSPGVEGPRGPRGQLPISTTGASGTITIVDQSEHHVAGIWVPNADGPNGHIRVGMNVSSEGDDILLLGVDATDTPFVSDAWVSASSPAPTLFASDIRAVQGTRPSNSQPEPFPGWEAAGLDDAMAGKAVVNIDRLNASAARFIAGAGVDADNLWKLIFDTDNRFKMIVRKSGVDEVTLQTGAVVSTGDKTIEWQAKPGDYAIAATGVAGDTDSYSATLPAGATTLRVGSNFGVINPFNGWISEIQIARAA